MPTVNGLVTGIDSDGIIQGLLQIQQQQIDRFSVRKQQALQQQAAVQAIEARLVGLQSSSGQLARVAGSPLTKRVASVSDENALVATASASADIGSYALRVNSLAQAHQVATQSLADPDADITQGTIEVRVGSRAVKTITIDDSTNTLQGLADALNKADAGLSATIVQGGNASYRLLLTVNDSGSQQAITLTNNLAAAAGSASRPTFDFDNPVQAAQDASLTIGRGAGAITVHSATNEFRNVLAGVTLNVWQADPDKVVTVNIAADTQAGQLAVEDFVDSFNQVLDLIDSQTGYDAATDQAGLLLGHRIVSDVRNQLRSVVLETVPGLGSGLNRLSALGISVTNQGRLQFDASKLDDILSGRSPVGTGQDVRRLFALDARSTNPGVQFILGSSRTQPSTTPIQVDITQAAEQARLSATTPLSATTTIDNSSDTLALSLDGVALEVTLTTGHFTAHELADVIEQAVNSRPDLSGRQLRVGVEGDGRLSLTSASYGRTSQVTVTGGNALPALGLSTGQTAIGVDVAGRFLVNGEVETAVGSGRALVGEASNAHTADLRLQVNLNPDQVTTGPEADLIVTRGVAARLNSLLSDLLSADHGRVQNLANQYQATADSVQTAIDRQQERFDRQRESLLKQFAAMEAAMSQLQSTSSFLGGQLAGLNSLAKQ
ncbi:MAG: flagellar filament capping protein FliD [Planctomycetaceae bacterium]